MPGIAESDPPEFRPAPPLADQLEVARDHPAMAWFDGIGGSAWPDDLPSHPRLLHECVARFRRGNVAAYIWFERPDWWLQPWKPLRRLDGKWEKFKTLGAALDQLTTPAERVPQRTWWRLWE